MSSMTTSNKVDNSLSTKESWKRNIFKRSEATTITAVLVESIQANNIKDYVGNSTINNSNNGDNNGNHNIESGLLKKPTKELQTKRNSNIIVDSDISPSTVTASNNASYNNNNNNNNKCTVIVNSINEVNSVTQGGLVFGEQTIMQKSNSNSQKSVSTNNNNNNNNNTSASEMRLPQIVLLPTTAATNVILAAAAAAAAAGGSSNSSIHNWNKVTMTTKKEKCFVCQMVVYQTEKLSFGQLVLHQQCFSKTMTFFLLLLLFL